MLKLFLHEIRCPDLYGSQFDGFWTGNSLIVNVELDIQIAQGLKEVRPRGTGLNVLDLKL